MASNSPEVKKKGVPAAERNCNPISLKSGAGQAACAGEMAAKIKFLIDLGMTQHDIAAHFKIKDTSLNPEDTHITDPKAGKPHCHRHARHMGLSMRHPHDGHEGHTPQKPPPPRKILVPHELRRA
ncbi:hypothetical protein LB561_22520 [Mesorhizobium sp. B292B1B]|uniref:hypothetical protein n=1 Tax=unclassified Mesorhizobium TaxID=325217 RepID=UPI00112983AA|nr:MULTISPECIES: hypothetical protein [unclassified Mesorhizobium]MBZ9922409.1 hypothetical protein [Mesorhizobium sp. BR1-1-7]MCA0016485.1 hypothetical protein [Mesorhizobium sp. B294B1A1]MCA0040056.1 hypothetical protein [Mesorhizobium sp. B292B1B]TPM43302.1 hypothetical protein FJ964_21550 [Mesorhizobium sp. B2-3-2]